MIKPDIHRGDIFWCGSIPTVGSEQNGDRPGIVVSNDTGNRHSPNVEVVFLTTAAKINDLPTHVGIQLLAPSIALCENITTVSKERLGSFIRPCSTVEMTMIDRALAVSLGLTSPVAKDSEDKINKAEIERDLYAKLYDQLLNVVIGEMAV